jgi:hypothetical protein
MASKESSLATTTPIPGWGLWFLWVLVHIVGYTIGVGVYRAVAGSLLPLYQDEQFTTRAYGYELWALGVGALAAILALAVGQGVLLRRILSKFNTLSWIALTFVGYVAGLLMLVGIVAIRIMYVNSTSDRATDNSIELADQFAIACYFLALVGGLGLIVGIAQNRLLAKYNVSSGVWLFANAISLASFAAVFALIVGFRVIWVDMAETLRFFLGAVISATLAGAITGVALVKMIPVSGQNIQEKQLH